MSSQEDLEEPWGQLVSMSGGSEERIPIVGEKFTVGRSKDTDHVIENNKCVSGVHCILSRDENSRIWLQDTSTNGTLVNSNAVHRSQILITDGALIRIVFRKDLPELNLSYQFNDLNSTTTDSQTTIDMTLEYEENDNDTVPNLKRKSDELQDSCPKRPALDTESTVTMVTDKEAGPEGEEETGEGREVSPSKPVPLDKKDSIEETLICQICQEILHDCVSLQPCMHSYCAGCYSDWMECSGECPACRYKVERISKNHIVNNLVDAYLRANPDKKRSEEDLKELDERNKITKDMLYPKKTTPRYDDDYSSSSSSSGSTDDYPSCGVPSISHLIPSSSLLPSPIPPPFAPIPISCRQCPGHAHPPVTALSGFVCTPSTNHILCMCCLQPMPDRRSDPDLSVPPQKCDVCGRAFCHMYWGCGKFGCKGCLNLFKDMDFDDTIMTYIINNNHYESKILKNFLTSKALTVKDLLQECLSKLDSGTFTSSDTRTSRISSSSRTCYQCALKNLQDLTYQYRQGIPSEELPSDVVSRSDCYYGKNCRTQKHNPEHCKKYNHICDQIRY